MQLEGFNITLNDILEISGIDSLEGLDFYNEADYFLTDTKVEIDYAIELETKTYGIKGIDLVIKRFRLMFTVNSYEDQNEEISKDLDLTGYQMNKTALDDGSIFPKDASINFKTKTIEISY